MNRFLLGVTLCGMSGEVWCDLAAPGITTLVQPTEAISRASVKCLMRLRETGNCDTKARQVHFQANLIARGPTCR